MCSWWKKHHKSSSPEISKTDKMDQKQDIQNEEPVKAITLWYDKNTADAVMKKGIEVYGVIKTCQEKQNPNDSEHSIFILKYEYEVDSRLFKRELKFSINIDHIEYGYAGGMYNTPKFKYSLDEFRNSMQRGQKLKIRTLKKPPYWFLVEANEVMAEIMQHEAVWR